LTSQKTNALRNSIIVAIAISVGIGTSLVFLNSCTARHFSLLNDLNQDSENMDPDFCYDLVQKIELFNEECEPQVEIIDCG
jgi:hypothetical protein